MHNEASGRRVENAGMWAAIFTGTLYGVAESLARMGVCVGNCTAFDNSFPWGLLIFAMIMAAPKTLGRMQAADILKALVSRLPGKSE